MRRFAHQFLEETGTAREHKAGVAQFAQQDGGAAIRERGANVQDCSVSAQPNAGLAQFIDGGAAQLPFDYQARHFAVIGAYANHAGLSSNWICAKRQT